MDDVFIKSGSPDEPRALVLLAGGAEEKFTIKPGETAEAFRNRIFVYAQGRGAESVVYGGLP